MNSTYPSITVCICTYNRAKSLATTLKSITDLIVPNNLSWEVIIIDNNSNDETKKIAYQFAKQLSLNYIFEPNQGLSFARNRALKVCRGELLIFTDDDIVFDTNWLSKYYQAARIYSEAEYFGGKIVPLWNGARPKWLKDSNISLISGLIGCYGLGGTNRFYNEKDMHPFGGNFALRRSMFEKLKPFRIDLGVCGSQPGRGEEAEYFQRAIINGFTGVYVSEAVCYHSVDPVHLNLNYIYRYGIQKGIAEVRMDRAVNNHGSFVSEIWYGIRGLWQLAKGRGDRFRQCVINMGIQAGLRRASMKKSSDHLKKCL